MNEPDTDDPNLILPKGGKAAKLSRAALQVVGGAVPLAGGVLPSYCAEPTGSDTCRSRKSSA